MVNVMVEIDVSKILIFNIIFLYFKSSSIIKDTHFRCSLLVLDKFPFYKTLK